MKLPLINLIIKPYKSFFYAITKKTIKKRTEIQLFIRQFKLSESGMATLSMFSFRYFGAKRNFVCTVISYSLHSSTFSASNYIECHQHYLF